MTARIAGLLNPSSPERNLALVVDENGDRVMRPPAEVCSALNELLLAEIETDRYLTMILADVDLETGRAVLSQAGHPSPAILRKDGTVEYVSSFGMPIGLIPDAEFSSFEINLAIGDRLLLHSDGITECPMPGAENLFEEEGLEDLLLDIFSEHGPDFIHALHQGLSHASGLTDFPDDLSAVLLERTI